MLWLTEIKLDPLLSDVTSPGYPDEKYQQIKWEYGVNLLKNAFGVPDYEDESVVSYDFEMGYILCYQYLTGRQVGEGGFIKIRYKRGGKI